MLRGLIAIAVVLISGGHLVARDAVHHDFEALEKAALRAIVGLATSLKGELKAALKSGGPVEAIKVCNVVAPEIARSQSKAHGMRVRRTALRFRNPNNRPDAFERRVMLAFLAAQADGKDLKTLHHSEVVRSPDGAQTFRFIKPIVMSAEPCLACHGDKLAPGVKEQLRKLYPEDTATGFKPGDLRGVFSISKPL